jgi:hypothetical protein
MRTDSIDDAVATNPTNSKNSKNLVFHLYCCWFWCSGLGLLNRISQPPAVTAHNPESPTDQFVVCGKLFTPDHRCRSGKRELVTSGLKVFFKTLAGPHLFAAMINLSALMIFGDRLARNGRLKRTTATSIQRSLHWPLCGGLFSPQWRRACFTRRALDWLNYAWRLHHHACLVSFLPLPNIASVRVKRWQPLKVSQ